MRFHELASLARSLDLGAPGSDLRPPRDNVRALQNTLATLLDDEEFCLDCIELEMRSTAKAKHAPGAPAHLPPFFALGAEGIFFRFFYWPPGKVAPPHEHTSWTVTGVFHHALTVTTYDWDTAVAERRLAEKNVFTAARGKVGHIYDDCIHRPSNPSDRLAVSIHIFNRNDGPVLEERVGPIAGLATDMAPPRWPSEPAAFERALRVREERLDRMHEEMLAPFRSPRAVALAEPLRARRSERALLAPVRI